MNTLWSSVQVGAKNVGAKLESKLLDYRYVYALW